MTDAKIRVRIQTRLDDERLLSVDIVPLGQQLQVAVQEHLLGLLKRKPHRIQLVRRRGSLRVLGQDEET
jgi:hypothetical protein